MSELNPYWAQRPQKEAISVTKRQERYRMEREYMNLTAEGMTRMEAAEKVGFNSHERRTPRKLIETAEMKRRMQRDLIRGGVTTQTIAAKLRDQLEARQVVSYEGVATLSDAPDHAAQHRASKTATELLGLTERSDSSGGGSSITLSVSGPLAERLAERLGGG